MRTIEWAWVRKASRKNESLGHCIISFSLRLCFFVRSSWLYECVCAGFFPSAFFLIPSHTLSISYELITASHCTIVPFIEMVMWSSRNTRRLLKSDSMPGTRGRRKKTSASFVVVVFLVYRVRCAHWSSSLCAVRCFSIRCWIIPFRAIFFSVGRSLFSA